MKIIKEISYRSIKKQDYNIICDIIDSTFGLNEYISNEKILKCAKKLYIYSCLSEATYTNLIEKNGEIIGIIMGNAKNDYKKIKHLKFILNYLWYIFKLKLSSLKYKEDIKNYEIIHKTYDEFLNKHKEEFDGVLTLFAIKDEFRGFGFGKILLENFLSYLQNQNVNNIYLYTDTTCNYEFYERKGFKRLEEKNLKIKRNNNDFEMSVFLYSYRLKK